MLSNFKPGRLHLVLAVLRLRLGHGRVDGGQGLRQRRVVTGVLRQDQKVKYVLSHA